MSANHPLSHYEAIIFDLGGVIINLDYDRSVDALIEQVPHLDPSVFNGKEKQLAFYSDYEVGKITSQEFLSAFNSHYHTELTLPQFSKAWNAMILDLPPERVRLLAQLRQIGKKVFLLSNINEIHEEELYVRYRTLGMQEPFQSLFDRAYYSHRLGQRKPTVQIFEHVLRENSLNPKTTLFIDDSQHHVEGARKAGIDSIHLVKPIALEDLEIFSPFFQRGETQ